MFAFNFKVRPCDKANGVQALLVTVAAFFACWHLVGPAHSAAACTRRPPVPRACFHLLTLKYSTLLSSFAFNGYNLQFGRTAGA